MAVAVMMKSHLRLRISMVRKQYGRGRKQSNSYSPITSWQGSDMASRITPTSKYFHMYVMGRKKRKRQK